MLTGSLVILILKIAVGVVTVLWLLSLGALLAKRYRLHGQLNLAFMVLTLTAVFGLEFLIRVYDPEMFSYFDPATKRLMAVHLCFSVPAAVLLPVMYVTGRSGRSRVHYTLAVLFSICWIGTFITGIFYLPHSAP